MRISDFEYPKFANRISAIRISSILKFAFPQSAIYNLAMPIYEFECRKCKAHLEVFQKINDKPPVKCRKCGGRLERKISAPAIQFKGSGWYVTDYASKATKGERSESESSAEAKPDKSEKAEKTSSPKKTSDKGSSPKASTGD